MMSGLKTRRKSVAVRLFAVNLLWSFIVFGFFGWWLYSGMRELGTRNAMEEAHSIASLAAASIDGIAETIRNTLFFITADDRLASPEYRDRARDLIANYGNVAAAPYRGIYVVHDDGELSASRQALAEVMDTTEIRAIAERSRGTPGRIVSSGPYRSSLSGFTIAFAYRPPKSRLIQYPASAVAELDIGYIGRGFREMVSRGRTLIVCTADNVPLYFDEGSEFLPFVADEYPRRLRPDRLAIWNEAPSGGGFLFDGDLGVVKAGGNEFAWNVYVVYERELVEEAAEKIVRNIRVAYVILVLFLVSEALFVSMYFSRPLRRLVREMDGIDALEDLRETDQSRDDEIGALIESYNALIRRILRMTAEVREAERVRGEYELKMLQSQIGPHFLYNTLACIGTLAAKNQSTQVRAIIRSLVDLLSYTFDKTGEMVSLEEEAKSVEAYAAIQKMRYGDIFELSFNLAPETRALPLPRLTLQPLVENALFHGIVPLKRDGRIRLVSRLRGAALHIWIGDDGMGMDDVRLREVLSFSRERDPRGDFGGAKFNSVGIANVDRRLKARYGSGYGLRLHSRSGAGTVVEIILPGDPSLDYRPALG